MIKSVRLGAICILVSTAASAQEHRELGAHQHGHGTFNVAIDGNAVSLELEAPGADIAGFEHEAKTAADKAALEKAKATLAAPLELFKVPAAANCTLKDSKVHIEKENHHEDHDDGDKEEAGGHHHTAFHAEYVLTCAAPASLTTLTFAYFSAFKNAQALTVEVISPKGQSKFEATREKPVIDLAGLM